MTDSIEDFGEHSRTYDLFLRIALMGSLHVAGVLVALVIATIDRSPVISVLGVIAITATAGYGLMRPGRGDPWPSVAVVVLLFILMGALA